MIELKNRIKKPFAPEVGGANFYHNKKMIKIKHFGWHKRGITMNKKIEEIIKDLKYWE